MTKTQKDPIIILMADDDDDDYLLTKKALKESKVLNTLVRVSDGQELIDYLKHGGKYAESKPERPGIILLDLNMPRKDGREALKEVKSDDRLKEIPIVVFTTSQAEEDVLKTYQIGVNSFITKPVTFDNLLKVMRTLERYWLEIVKLPKGNGNGTQ